jgi:O-antigen/teichoic acid export membrane protein
MNGVLSTIKALVTGEVLRGSATMFAVRLTGALAGVLMFALLSRRMAPPEFDLLVVTFNSMSFLAAIALCGQETLIIRSWGEYCGSNRPARARGVLQFSASVALGASALVTIIAFIAWHLWDPVAPLLFLVAACSFLFSQSLMQYTGQWSRVAAGVVIGDGHREITWKAIVIATIGAFALLNLSFSATEFFFAAAAGFVIAIGWQLFQTVRLIPAEVMRAKPQYSVPEWIPRSFNMWLSALLDTTGQYLEVVLVALILNPSAAASFFIATRISNLFALISTSISNYATSRISHLYFSGSRDALQDTLRTLAILGAVLVGSSLILVIAAGKLLLWIFGPQFVSVYPVLVILVIGASIGALAGPAAQILLLTGHERIYPRIVSAAVAFRFALIAILGAMFGLYGVATAWSIGTAILAFGLIISCRRLVGLDPSLLLMLRPMRNPESQV